MLSGHGNVENEKQHLFIGIIQLEADQSRSSVEEIFAPGSVKSLQRLWPPAFLIKLSGIPITS